MMLPGTKIFAGVVVAAAVTFGLYSLSQRHQPARETAAAEESAAVDTRLSKVKAANAHRPQQWAAKKPVSEPPAQAPVDLKEREKRIQKLSNDLATSSPEIVLADGETTGRLHFNVEVVNESGLPVAGATVKMTGRRTSGSTRANWYGWGKPAVSVQTNDKGLARVNSGAVRDG